MESFTHMQQWLWGAWLSKQSIKFIHARFKIAFARLLTWAEAGLEEGLEEEEEEEEEEDKAGRIADVRISCRKKRRDGKREAENKQGRE